jgi:hypothetical protein
MSKALALSTHTNLHLGLIVGCTISGVITGAYLSANNQKGNNGAFDDTISMAFGIVAGGVFGLAVAGSYPVSIPLIGYYAYRKNVRKNESTSE